MNKKKILAIAIAIILLILSFLTSHLKSEIKKEFLNGKQDGLKSFFDLKDDGKETIIENGDPFNKIATIEYNGEITSDIVYEHFMNNLEKILNDESIKGVIMEANSPGGGVYESEKIANKIKEIKKERNIPFYTSMGQVAASGGYYISAPTDKIYAANETITGSIGVIMSGLNYSGLFEKYGIGYDVVKSAELKDIGSPYKQRTEKEKEVLQNLINTSYDRFVKIVSEGRKMDENTVRTIADGRIYDGSQAVNNGLVDEIGYFEKALDDLKKNIGVENPQVIRYDYLDTSLSSLLSLKTDINNLAKSEIEKNIDTLKKLQQDSSIRPMYLYGGM